ncbi:hypothetical protein, partial [Mesorhizobium japonicum]|uniref:hypothetical protein n=1 Tax=Mesorhizobium japonicum TaxID=2066070 RepID=UPI003B5C8D86
TQGLAVMRGLFEATDPHGNLNPGKVAPALAPATAKRGAGSTTGARRASGTSTTRTRATARS